NGQGQVVIGDTGINRVNVEQLQPAMRQCASKAAILSVRYEQPGASILYDRGKPGVRESRIERYVAFARLQHPQESRKRLHPVLEQQPDRFWSATLRGEDHSCYAISRLIQLVVGESPVYRLDRHAVTELLHLLFETVRERLLELCLLKGHKGARWVHALRPNG